MKIKQAIIRLPALAAVSIMLGYGDVLKRAASPTNIANHATGHRVAKSVDAITLDNDIGKFAEMMSNTNISTKGLWAFGTNILARIVGEVDEDVYLNHFQKMEAAILGVRFKEGGPFADSYNEWERSISLFSRLSFLYSVSLWKKKKDIHRGWEFKLKLLEIYRREIERIAATKDKPPPTEHNGILGNLQCVRSRLISERDIALKGTFCDGKFAEYFISLSDAERDHWRMRIETASGMKFELDERWKKFMVEAKVRKPYDGGDVLPHPFTFFGCTLGKIYDNVDTRRHATCRDQILDWGTGFMIEPYFGKEWSHGKLAPRSRQAFSAYISWNGKMTWDETLFRMKEIKADIEKRYGIKLGEIFFEVGDHVCDEATLKAAASGCAKSRSVFGKTRIEITAERSNASAVTITLEAIDTEAEAMAEKERGENPLRFDLDAEWRQRKERNQRYKAREQEKSTAAEQVVRQTTTSP